LNPDFIGGAGPSTVGDAIKAVSVLADASRSRWRVFVTGEGGRLAGTALLVELLRADPQDSVAVATRPDPASLPADATSTRCQE